MCKSQAEGGQRCAASTRVAVASARHALEEAEAVFGQARAGRDRTALAVAVAERERARQALDDAHAAHASTREGEREYRQALDAALASKPESGDATEDARQFAIDVGEEVRLTRILRRGAEMRETSRRLSELARLRRTGTPVTSLQLAHEIGSSPVNVTFHTFTERETSEGPARLVGIDATTVRWTQDGQNHTSLLGTAIYSHDDEYTIVDDNGPLMTFAKIT